jgi:hypothetical protein
MLAKPMGSTIPSIATEIFFPNSEENVYPELVETDTRSVDRYVVHISTI